VQSSNLQPRCRPVRLLTYFSLSHSKSKAVKYQTQKKSQMSCCFEKMLNMAMYLLGIVCLGFALFHLHSLWAVTWHWLLSGWPSGVLSVEHSLVVGSVSDKANKRSVAWIRFWRKHFVCSALLSKVSADLIHENWLCDTTVHKHTHSFHYTVIQHAV